MIYLHEYPTVGDFEKAYGDYETQIVGSFVCSAGTFEYYGTGMYVVASYWKNEGRELITPTRTVSAGGRAGDPETQSQYEITAVSQSGGVVTAFTCSEGTFIYDRESLYKIPNGDPFQAWVNSQNQVLYTVHRNAAVGNGGGQDSGAYDMNNRNPVEITQVNMVDYDPAYHEPWVSATEINRIYDDSQWFDYVGEVDVYDSNEPNPYLGKMHLWQTVRSYRRLTLTESPAVGDTLYACQLRDDNTYYKANEISGGVGDIDRGIKVDYNKPWYTVKVLTYKISGPSNLLADTSYYSSNTVSFNELLAPAFTAWGKRNDLSVCFFYGDTFEEDDVNMFMSGYCYSTSEELTKSDIHVRNATIYDLQNERFVSNDRGQVIMIIVETPPPAPVG